MKRFILLLCFITTAASTQAQNDTIFFWKNNAMIHKQSIKTADLDSITFRRPPVDPNGINIAGPNVTDIDGNTYQSVSNCGLTFTKQNLNVTKYSDGTPIPQVLDPTHWASLTTGAWCYYENYTANGPVYGKLYNWYAVAGIYDAASLANPALRKKLAPTGWHIPTDTELSSLINCLDLNANGGFNYPNVAGGKMKAIGSIQAGTGLWESPNTGATNESGFTGLPGGMREENGTFAGLGGYGYWWNSAGNSPGQPFLSENHLLYFGDGSIYRQSNFIRYGFSIRCVKD